MHEYLWPVLAALVAGGTWVAIRLTIARERFTRNVSEALASLDLRDESEIEA
jgi:hypothetical protein